MTPEELNELYGKGSESSPKSPSPLGEASTASPKQPVRKPDAGSSKKIGGESEYVTKKGPSAGTVFLVVLVVLAIGIVGYHQFFRKSAPIIETAQAPEVSKQIVSSNSFSDTTTNAILGAIDSSQNASNQGTASLPASEIVGTSNAVSVATSNTVSVATSTNVLKAEVVEAMVEVLKKKEMEMGPDFGKEFSLGYSLFGLAGGKVFVAGPSSSQPLKATWSEEKILVEEDYLHVWLPEIQIGSEEKLSLLKDVVLPARAGEVSVIKFDLASKTIVNPGASAEKSENDKAPSHEITVRILSVDESGIVAVFGLKGL